jgi:hypothetical protein
MKTLLKLTLAFAFGAAITGAVLLPNLNNPSGETPQPAQDIQAEIFETTEKALSEPAESPETAEVSPEAEMAALSDETKPEPVQETDTEAQAAPDSMSSPSPQTEQTEPRTVDAYPKEWYENGKKYAYLTEYAEQAGQKTEIIEYAEGEPNIIPGEFYDWENDPLRFNPGPLNGNGATGNN